MANGRLAHVSVPANSYATIYTNSSGSQASVTLAADGTETGKLSFRISQDANPANTVTTTLATETFVLNDDLQRTALVTEPEYKTIHTKRRQ